MIPAPPQVGDTVVILAAPFEMGVVEHVQSADVDVRIAAGHPVRVAATDVRVVDRRAFVPSEVRRDDDGHLVSNVAVEP